MVVPAPRLLDEALVSTRLGGYLGHKFEFLLRPQSHIHEPENGVFVKGVTEHLYHTGESGGGELWGLTPPPPPADPIQTPAL